jgi:hypothetical protein
VNEALYLVEKHREKKPSSSRPAKLRPVSRSSKAIRATDR